MLRQILAGILVTSVMGAAIIGCGSNEKEEPKIRSGVLSVEEYLEVCPNWSGDSDDNIEDKTWGEAIDESAMMLKLMKSAHAPKELKDYHISQVMMLVMFEEEIRKVGKDREDEIVNVAALMTPQIMLIGMATGGAADSLPDDLRNRLIDAGCVNDTEIEFDDESETPTP